jgi:ABC-type glutathione transport system ATPase component
VRQKWNFFVKKEYWGFEKKDKPHRDLKTWLTNTSNHHTIKSIPQKPKRSFLSQIPFLNRIKLPYTNRFKRLRAVTSSYPPEQEESLEDSEVTSLRSAAHDLSTPAALRVVHLRKQFGPFIAVKDSNFVMHQGELLAVLGANGSGKSTTCHVLCGITRATAGDALVDDEVSLLEERMVGWCPQHDILFDELTPLEHVCASGSCVGWG